MARLSPQTASATLPPVRRPNYFRGSEAEDQTLICGVLRNKAILNENLVHPAVELYISFKGLLTVHNRVAALQYPKRQLKPENPGMNVENNSSRSVCIIVHGTRLSAVMYLKVCFFLLFLSRWPPIDRNLCRVSYA